MLSLHQLLHSKSIPHEEIRETIIAAFDAFRIKGQQYYIEKHSIDWDDPILFPPQLYPGLEVMTRPSALKSQHLGGSNMVPFTLSPQLLCSSTNNGHPAETRPVSTLLSDSRAKAVSTTSSLSSADTIHTHQERLIQPLPSHARKDDQSSSSRLTLDDQSSSSRLTLDQHSNTTSSTDVPKLTIRLPTSLPTTSTHNPSPLAPIPTINVIDSAVTPRGSDLHKCKQEKQGGVNAGMGGRDDEEDAYVPPAHKCKVIIFISVKPSPADELWCALCIKQEELHCDHRCTICQQKGISCVPPPIDSRWSTCDGYRENTSKKACSMQSYFKGQKLQHKALALTAWSNQAFAQGNATR
ncbi:uncharacterized protein LACBIDRAFT_322407 [Laccaria bicolor S238N-H82]|uniref:Predicted protein n=1 Tax=Laccaria bicolor (strain S238N-H82 / ATCC MYA-4686) TaxID=486041 RepID=B0CW64_LACBS|nr:uncharacterized protein LACBIDRAFT_322407 [Laccaria bicolor S238N-H82]EDR13012.1 predicted protein [Laccaria bicolor S238N-H82]|eukprot:XP_001875510.1 predicted protein [Laccaria bicolor S238N-H82]